MRGDDCSGQSVRRCLLRTAFRLTRSRHKAQNRSFYVNLTRGDACLVSEDMYVSHGFKANEKCSYARDRHKQNFRSVSESLLIPIELSAITNDVVTSATRHKLASLASRHFH